MDLGLKGRTAIVCGASSGIGLAIAEALAEEGANVSMFARRREILEREAERLGALSVRGDLTNPADLQRLVDRTVTAFGGIDILVNNGGGPPRTSAEAIDDELLEGAVALLLVSAVRLTNLCLPHLRQSGHGRVVNITSSSVREPVDNLALSNAVRPGVVGWAKTLSRAGSCSREPNRRVLRILRRWRASSPPRDWLLRGSSCWQQSLFSTSLRRTSTSSCLTRPAPWPRSSTCRASDPTRTAGASTTSPSTFVRRRSS